MKRDVAVEVKQHALGAVESLSRALNSAKVGYSDEEMAKLHSEVGQLIGRLQMGVLEPIYEQFPDLDDLQ